MSNKEKQLTSCKKTELQREELQSYAKNFKRILADDDPWRNLKFLIVDMDTLLKEYELALAKDIHLLEKRKVLAKLEMNKLQVWLRAAVEMICQIAGRPFPNLLEEEPEDFMRRALAYTTSYYELEEAEEFTFEKYFELQNNFYLYFRDYMNEAISNKDVPVLCYLANWMGLNFVFHSERLTTMRLLNAAYKEKCAGPYKYVPIKLDE